MCPANRSCSNQQSEGGSRRFAPPVPRSGTTSKLQPRATVCSFSRGATRRRSATLGQSKKGFHERTAALQRIDALSAVHGGVVLELWRILQVDGRPAPGCALGPDHGRRNV